MPGDKGAPKDKTFTKLHQAVWKEDVDAVKKFVKIDRTPSEYGDNKFGSGGKKRLKLAASTFAAGAKLEYDPEVGTLRMSVHWTLTEII